MKNKLALTALLLLGLMVLGSTTEVLAQESWHIVPTMTPYDYVEFYVTKTYSADSVEFKVEIVSDNPAGHVWAMGMIISTDVSTLDFQVFYREWLAPYGWYYQEYTPGWGDPVVALPTLGITATGDHLGKIFTVTIPTSLLGGPGATYYFAIMARTNLMGQLPQGLGVAIWSFTDATKFIPNAVPPQQVIPEVPFGTIMAFASMFIVLAGFIGFKRFRPRLR